MKDKKYVTTLYKNGFVVRRQGRRIHFLEARDGFWELCFFRVRTEKFSEADKVHFDMVVEKMDLTYTVKKVIVSRDAMEEIAVGMLGYLRLVENKQMMIP